MTEMPAAAAPEEVIRRVYAAFQAGDLEAVLDSFAPDASFEAVGSPPLLPFSGRWQGRAELRRFFLALAETAEVLRFEPEEVLPLGPGRVFATGWEEMRLRSTGNLVRSRWAHLFTLAGGRIASGTEWADTAALLVAHRGY